MRPHLLGFDVRALQSPASNEWPAERRAMYLLRDDVDWPLSVDRAVWPSLFHFEPRNPLRFRGAVDVEASTVVQLGIELWDDYAAMEQTLKQKFLAACPGVRIAVELVYHELVGDLEWDFLATEIPMANHVIQNWKHVGYDIADRYLVSGLSNCSYNEKDRAALKDWMADINDFGLIKNVNRAREFCILSDRRVPDHAPFFVYGLRADF